MHEFCKDFSLLQLFFCSNDCILFCISYFLFALFYLHLLLHFTFHATKILLCYFHFHFLFLLSHFTVHFAKILFQFVCIALCILQRFYITFLISLFFICFLDFTNIFFCFSFCILLSIVQRFYFAFAFFALPFAFCFGCCKDFLFVLFSYICFPILLCILQRL